MAFPKVSIIIPAFKPGHFEQCLRSAIGQTYPNTEILVSDNCKTEEIMAICSKFSDVIYRRNPIVGTGNFISAMFAMEGVFIKPLFDDDILHPFCVERMVAAMALNNEIDMVFSSSQIIDIENKRLKARRPFTSSGFMSGKDLRRKMVLGFNNFIGEFSSIMIRREKLLKIGSENLLVVAGHDFILGLADMAAYCNLVSNGFAYYIDEELSYFRRDKRLLSLSNPNSNSNFGYCVSQHIDLLLASHLDAIISTEELLAAQEQVKNLKEKQSSSFTQVTEAYDRYIDYTNKFNIIS